MHGLLVWVPAGRTAGRTGGALADALPDALDPGFHCVRTHWIRGFMGFRRRRTWGVMLMVSA